MLVALLVSLLSSQAWGSHTLTPAQRRVLDAWLGEHRTYRLATDSDCKCQEEIDQMRRGWKSDGWPPVPNYHPYQVVGDFNGDGLPDLAVVLIDQERSRAPSAIAIFNGPFRRTTASPAFLEKDLSLAHRGLFFGPPRPKPYRLIVGPFESDNTGLLLPTGRTYKWDESAHDE
jgi:hypothetical protein